MNRCALPFHAAKLKILHCAPNKSAGSFTRAGAMESEAAAAAGEMWCGGAGSVLALTPGSLIPVCYHSSFGPHDDLLLLEVEEKLLPDILHNRAKIRGQADEDAMLCTSSATYSMKFVGTSNSVFLIPPGDSTPSKSPLTGSDGVNDSSTVSETVASVIKVASGSLELIQVAPKLDKLKALLNERPYRLEEELENDIRIERGMYRWDDLVELIQASEEELRVGLRSLSAVEISGYWRIVDKKDMVEVLSMILNNSILKEWSHNALEEAHVVSALEADGFPPGIVRHCLETFGNKMDAVKGLWSLDGKRVCMCFAAKILSGGKMKLDSFKEKWLTSVPSGMAADLKMLEGEVLYERAGVQDWIRAFSVADLPSSPAERFAALFREKPKWEWKDLEPYIRDLSVPGLTAEGLLIKYTRRTQPHADADPIFSPR